MISVKIVQVCLFSTPSGKPTFEKMGQMFIEVGENTANVRFILSAAQAEFGTDHIVVTSDGLQLHNNTGTQGLFFFMSKIYHNLGLKFWKVPNRKIYAVPQDDLHTVSCESLEPPPFDNFVLIKFFCKTIGSAINLEIKLTYSCTSYVFLS